MAADSHTKKMPQTLSPQKMCFMVLTVITVSRFSHENPSVQACYREYFEKPLSHRAHELLHVEE